jgi:MFS family permease
MRAPIIDRWFLPVILSGQFMANVDSAIANVATPAIGASLHASGAELQLTVSSYLLASAALLVTAARLGANVGRRRLFLGGLATFTLASLACGLAPTAAFLIAARVVQGIGGALMVAQVVSSIQLVFEGPARVRAVGALTMALSISAVIGQLLGGALVSANLFGSSWRPIFLINLPFGIALFVLALRALPADAPPAGGRPRLDTAGALLFASAMVLLVLPLTLGRELGWPVWTWVAMALAVVLTGAFVRWERAAANAAPLVRPGLFGSPSAVLGLVALTCSRLTYFSLIFVIALYLQIGLGESALVSGLSFVAWVGAYGLAGPLISRLPPRLAAAGTWAGPLLMAAAFAGLAVATAHGAGGSAAVVVLLGFGGFVWGITSTTQVSYLTATVDRAYAPDLSGVLSTMAPLATVVGIATYGSAYLALARSATGGTAANAFAIICVAFAATNVVGGLASISSARVGARRASTQYSRAAQAPADPPASPSASSAT